MIMQRSKGGKFLPDKAQWNAIFDDVFFGQTSTFLPGIHRHHVNMEFGKLKKRIKLIFWRIQQKLDLKMEVEANCAIITSRKNGEGKFDNFYNDNNEINAVMIVWCFAS